MQRRCARAHIRQQSAGAKQVAGTRALAFTFNQIRYFMAVAEAHAVSKAAHDLNISQSAVTEAIKGLEADLGVTLFERHARGMELTRAGREFQRHAGHIIASVADARRSLRARPEAVSGRLNLGTTSMVAGYFLADLLARYKKVASRVEVNVQEDDRFYVEHQLLNGELDAAVILTSNLVDRQALESVTLVRSRCRLWLPGTHPLLDRDRISLAEVQDEPLIVLTVDEHEDATARLWRQHGLAARIALKTSSVEAVRSFVATGAGIAILPDMTYRPWSLEGDRVEAREIVEPIPTVDVGFVWCRGVPVAETARAFLDLVGGETERVAP